MKRACHDLCSITPATNELCELRKYLREETLTLIIDSTELVVIDHKRSIMPRHQHKTRDKLRAFDYFLSANKMQIVTFCITFKVHTIKTRCRAGSLCSNLHVVLHTFPPVWTHRTGSVAQLEIMAIYTARSLVATIVCLLLWLTRSSVITMFLMVVDRCFELDFKWRLVHQLVYSGWYFSMQL